MKRVLIAAASSAIVRAGLEALLASSPAFTLVGALESDPAGAESWRELRPDVIIADLSGQASESIANFLGRFVEGEEATAPPIVILSDEDIGLPASSALRAGVRAVLPRTATGEEILAAIEAAANGLLVVHPDSFDSLQRGAAAVETSERARLSAKVDALTERELEILGMLAEGLGNKVIAQRLGISDHTVKFHVRSILAKLGAASRTEAVTIGIRQGLLMV